MYQKILVPLDGSKFSETILNHARAVATGCSVPEVILLTVIEPFAGQPYPVSDEWLNRLRKEAVMAAQSYLNQVAAGLKDAGITAKSVVIEGRVADAILDYATKNKVDLIIMSTHGRSGVSRWVFGSVADRVVRTSTIPVLAAPPPALGRKK